MHISKLLIVLALLCGSAAAQIGFGTPTLTPMGAASTTGTSSSNLVANSGDFLYCGVVFDENGSGTNVTGIVVAGSPTYATAWHQQPTDGSVFVSGQGGLKFWWAIASSAVNGAVTHTISSSERSAAVCNSASSVDPSTTIGGTASNFNPAFGGDPVQFVITNTAHDKSKYLVLYGCFDNIGHTFTSNANMTDDGCVNCANEASVWVHIAVAHLTTEVSPAANTTVGYSQTKGSSVNSCAQAMLIGAELLKVSSVMRTRAVRIMN